MNNETSTYILRLELQPLASVAQKLDSTIHWINLYPAAKYPLDSLIRLLNN